MATDKSDQSRCPTVGQSAPIVGQSAPIVDICSPRSQSRSGASWIFVHYEGMVGRLLISSAPSWGSLMINHLPRSDMGSRHGRTTCYTWTLLTCGSRAAVGRQEISDYLVRPETNPGAPQSSAGLLSLALSLRKKEKKETERGIPLGKKRREEDREEEKKEKKETESERGIPLGKKTTCRREEDREEEHSDTLTGMVAASVLCFARRTVRCVCCASAKVSCEAC